MKLIFIEISKNLLELIDVHPDLSGKMKGFEFIERIQLVSWIQFWKTRFSTNNNDWFTQFIQNYVESRSIDEPESSDTTQTMFNNGKTIYRSAANAVYREKYIENCQLYTKTTIIFF